MKTYIQAFLNLLGKVTSVSIALLFATSFSHAGFLTGMVQKAKCVLQSTEQTPPRPQSNEPWLKEYRIDPASTDTDVFSIVDVVLLKDDTEIDLKNLNPTGVVYYIAAGNLSGYKFGYINGGDIVGIIGEIDPTILIRSKKIADIDATGRDGSSLVSIEGKLVLKDNTQGYTAPLVTADTYEKYMTAYENKRKEYLAVALQFIELDNIGEKLHRLEKKPNIFEFYLKSGVTLKTNRGEFTSDERNGMWSITVGDDGTVYMNDGWGDTVGILGNR